MKTVLQEVTQADIPTELSERLAEEKRIEAVSAIGLKISRTLLHQ